MNAKKIIALTMVFCLTVSAVMAKGSSRKDIDAYLKSYEQVVVQAEKAAKSNKMSDLMSLSTKVAKLTDQANKIQSSDEWTMSDSQKLLSLTDRYAKALEKMSDSSSSMDLDSFDLDDFDF